MNGPNLHTGRSFTGHALEDKLEELVESAKAWRAEVEDR